MTSSSTLWAALVLATAVNTSVIAGDVSNQVTSDDTQPSGQITNVLRSLAGALSAGSEAMRPFHGLMSENEDNKDDLDPAIPGMECYIDRILSYVSCYSPSIGTEKDADSLISISKSFGADAQVIGRVEASEKQELVIKLSTNDISY